MTAFTQLRSTHARWTCALRSLALLPCLLALGCNTFDSKSLASQDGAGPGFAQAPNGGAGIGTSGTAGNSAVMMFPSPSETAPPGSIGVPGCSQCGSFCADCGRGCECKEGHTPFDAPVWNVPFAPVGTDGWMDSSRALCAGMDSVISTRLWVGDDGVYALVGGMARALSEVGGIADDDAGIATEADSTPSFGMGARTRVLHNDGSGWALRADVGSASMDSGLTGFPHSTLILYGGRGQDEAACPLGVVSGRTFTCQPVVGTVQSAVAVNDNLAFALTGTRDMLVFDGKSWHSTTELPAPANAIWASEQELIAVGPDGNVMRLQEGAWRIESVGQLARLTAVWGTSGNDLWAGGFNGSVFHYDGMEWQEVTQLGGVSCRTQPPIEHIWGAGSDVWVSTASQLARLHEGAMETFGNWTCSSLGEMDVITGLWGRNDHDVFVAVSNSDTLLAPCGGAYLVHFDGKSFHRF
jgi:hypothetical protein